jgi:hypothetical protein
MIEIARKYSDTNSLIIYINLESLQQQQQKRIFVSKQLNEEKKIAILNY